MTRLLCLHGFRSDGSRFRSQLGPLLVALDPTIDALYPDAPNPSGWWNAVPIAGGAPAAKHYEGYQRSLDWAARFVEQSGPFDGVFGFSQGAAFAALLVGSGLDFEFAVLAGGFVSNDPEHASLYQNLNLRSLHLIGRADRVVPREASFGLAARFEAAIVFEHDGGHVIPHDPAARTAIGAFLAS